MRVKTASSFCRRASGSLEKGAAFPALMLLIQQSAFLLCPYSGPRSECRQTGQEYSEGMDTVSVFLENGAESGRLMRWSRVRISAPKHGLLFFPGRAQGRKGSRRKAVGTDGKNLKNIQKHNYMIDYFFSSSRTGGRGSPFRRTIPFLSRILTKPISLSRAMALDAVDLEIPYSCISCGTEGR